MLQFADLLFELALLTSDSSENVHSILRMESIPKQTLCTMPYTTRRVTRVKVSAVLHALGSSLEERLNQYRAVCGVYFRLYNSQNSFTVAGPFPAYNAALRVMPNPLRSFSALNGTIDWK